MDREGKIYRLTTLSELPAGTTNLEITDTEGKEIRVDIFTGKSEELIFPLDNVRRPA